MALVFEWDPAKAAANLNKHSVTFAEAATAFADVLSFTFPDPDHSTHEDRYITFGLSREARFLVIAHTDRDGKIRIISAREMTRSEKCYYEETR
jgi:uncharacterized protein